jgi:hypothetical protein
MFPAKDTYLDLKEFLNVQIIHFIYLQLLFAIIFNQFFTNFLLMLKEIDAQIVNSTFVVLNVIVTKFNDFAICHFKRLRLFLQKLDIKFCKP